MNNSNITGLTDSEVVESRRQYGSNKMKELGRRTGSILFEIIKEPMLILLLSASLIYFITGNVREGFIMAGAIFFVAGISIYQQVRSENSLEALRKLTQARVNVIRNGIRMSIESEELVVGDVMVVSEGQEVSADAEILDQNDLSIDESLLTGESDAVRKGDSDNKLFAGTTVVSGLGHALVSAVGNNTRLGNLGAAMQGIVQEKTPLQIQINTFVRRLAYFGVSAFILVTFYNFLESGNLLYGVMHGLALAMAVLPEEIPVAFSTFMALGAYQMSRQDILVKQPQLVETLGAATVICVDKTGTITENKMTIAELYDYRSRKVFTDLNLLDEPDTKNLLQLALLASEPIPFDPMEKAIHILADRLGIKKDNFRMIKEYPLSGSPPFMTHIYLSESNDRIISAKGAPEGILRNSSLAENEKNEVIKTAKSMAAKGYRVLGVAESDFKADQLPESQQEFNWNFLGLLALNDPPKKNIPEVITGFYDAGIHVKMITGDFPETAIRIAEKVGINNPLKYVTGAEIMKMDDAELKKTLPEINIYARILPETKLRIINAFKELGEVVAMTGDGVNDGPALKAAHIGVAMGDRGTEVARQASSLILLKDDLSGMIKAIGFGRKIYANLKLAIQYIISIHIPLISIVTLPLLLGWKFPNIFSPVHVIFLELVMGPTCSIVFENEPMARGILSEKPRKLKSTFFTWKELYTSILQGVLITAALMFVLHYSIFSGYSENAARTMVFTTLVFSNILLTLTGRSKTESILTTITYKNKLIPLIICLTLVILFVSLFFPPAQSIFEFDTISFGEILFCFGIATLFVMWIELFKIRKSARVFAGPDLIP